MLFLTLTGNFAIGVMLNVIGLLRGRLINNADQPLLDRFQLADASIEGLEIADIWLGGGMGGCFLVGNPLIKH